MKIETLLLLGAAVGVGFLIAKRRAATISPTVAAKVAVAPTLELAPSVVVVEPSVEYVPYPMWGGGGWGWGGGGRRRHHGGGHHRRRH